MTKLMDIFSQLFGGFLVSRRTSHLFRRRVIFESLSKEGRAGTVPDPLSRQLEQQARNDLGSVLVQLGTRPRNRPLRRCGRPASFGSTAA